VLAFLLALLTTATVGALLIPFLRTRSQATGRFDAALAIYRDQLAEIERERATGTLPEAEGEVPDHCRPSASSRGRISVFSTWSVKAPAKR